MRSDRRHAAVDEQVNDIDANTAIPQILRAPHQRIVRD